MLSFLSGPNEDLFTVVLYDGYSSPSGFSFDKTCDDGPIIDDITSPRFNVHEKVNDFIKYVNEERMYYRTNNILVTMGGDFHFKAARYNFKNIDKLIRYLFFKSSIEGNNISFVEY